VGARGREEENRPLRSPLSPPPPPPHPRHCARNTGSVIRRLPHVDRVGIEERAATLGRRSIKTTAKQQGIRLAVSMIDLTTLEGADTPGKVRHLCAKAVCPAPELPEVPSCAAVCVYPSLVGVTREALAGTGVKTASVATAFPSGQASLEVKLRDTEDAVAAGADEIDMVISREAFLAGEDTRVMEEIVRVKEVCGDAHLKVIIETAELGSYDHVRHASMISMEAGADFVKTSTGKAASGATPGVVLVMLEAIRDYAERSGRAVGMKAAGGVSSSKAALHMLVLVKETLGDDWLTPDRFRIGASSLLNDLLMQYQKTQTGRYARPEDFSKE
jgi:deoxyribose-phosphate aldolase